MKPSLEKEFITMLETYKAIVHKIANLYGKTAEDRKDLFQDILINLWKAYPAFKAQSKKSTWIYQIGLNIAISNYRRQSKQLSYEPIYDLSIETFGESLAYEQADQINFLYKAIESLTAIDKAIILLYLEEKSYKEISDIMGISVANVGMKITRIKTKLQERVTKINQ